MILFAILRQGPMWHRLILDPWSSYQNVFLLRLCIPRNAAGASPQPWSFGILLIKRVEGISC